jgi:hypothetical protein
VDQEGADNISNFTDETVKTADESSKLTVFECSKVDKIIVYD